MIEIYEALKSHNLQVWSATILCQLSVEITHNASLLMLCVKFPIFKTETTKSKRYLGLPFSHIPVCLLRRFHVGCMVSIHMNS